MAQITINEISQGYSYNIGTSSYATVALPITSSWGPGYFNPDNLISRYESYYNILKLSGAVQREENKWSGDSDVYGHDINFEKELEYIKNWINMRISFLDKQFQYEYDTYISKTTHQSERPVIYSLSGQSTNILNQRKSNIYIINGKKVLLK